MKSLYKKEIYTKKISNQKKNPNQKKISIQKKIISFRLNRRKFSRLIY